MTEQSTTELTQPTSMEDVKERIALRIKASFVELMPEEAWTKMVETELACFTQPQIRGRGQPLCSNIQLVIREILKERFCEMLRAELAQPEYDAHFGVNGQAEPGEFVRVFLKENMAAIVTALLGRLGQDIVDKVKTAISQDIGSQY